MATHSTLAPAFNAAVGLGDYVRHRPEDTVLYDIVRAHLDEFLDAASEREHPLPRYVEQEFRKYLRCGILANGFARCLCDGCGADVLVAFSCKNRGVCPSCSARRMCATAAQIADDVLPAVPLRQWVITFPFELRLVLATKASALSSVLRVAIDEISKHYVSSAKKRGLVDPRPGAVSFCHRFGSSLNLNVHFHVPFLDGVYVDSGTAFSTAPPPTREELCAVVERIQRRVAKWARRSGVKLQNSEPTSDVSLAHVGTTRGLFATLDERGRPVDPDPDADRFDPRGRGRLSVQYEGFDLHAGATVAASDREGRERLCRYGARPAFALKNISLLPDGRIAYRLKYVRPNGHTHRVMSPVEFLARIAALIPPPRFPLVRYHGVLAPNAKLRARVVPSTNRVRPKSVCPVNASQGAPPALLPPRSACAANQTGPEDGGCAPIDSPARLPIAPLLAPRFPVAVTTPAAGPGPRNPPSSDRRKMERIDWPTLLKRIHNVDVLECPRCGGRLRIVASIIEPRAIRRVLEHLGESATGPPPARILEPWAAGGP